MRDHDASVCIHPDIIVGAHIVVDRDVHIAFLTRIKDFTGNFQLSWRDRAIKEVSQDFPQAVDSTDFDGRVVRITDRDADVQHLVTVDDIVTATALDDIATAAPQQDVATNEQVAGVYPHDVAKEFTQPVNAVDAFLGQFICKERDFVVQQKTINRCIATNSVVTPDHVVVLRTRHGLRINVAVFEEFGLLRNNASGQVDLRTRIGVLVHNPVVPEFCQVHMSAFALNKDIVAAFAMKVVVVRAAPKDIMALYTRSAKIVVVVAEQEVKAVSAFDPVVSFSAIDNVGPRATQHKVVAHSGKGVLSVVGTHHDDIVSATTKDKLASAATR